MMKKTKRLVWSWSLTAAMLAIVMSGCKNTPTQPETGSLSLSLRFLAKTPRAALPKSASANAFTAVDSIRLTRARLVLSKIELESEGDSAEFRSAPMVLELDLSGAMQTLGVIGVPFGAYNEVEFKIHRVDSADLAAIPPAEQTRFADFLPEPFASVILAGVTYANGAGQPFVYRSDLNAEQEYTLTPPLLVSAINPAANLTINIDASNWFKDRNGVLLDPADRNNESQIKNNVKTSFQVYEDDDRDGDDDEGGD